MIEQPLPILPVPERRYPGPRPFILTDQPIFKGRSRELAELLERVRQYPHLLLHAKSGAGKSSLIEAGLMPALRDSGEFKVFKFVFGAYNKNQPTPPLENLLIELRKQVDGLNYLDKLIYQENSLWYCLKVLQSQWIDGRTKGILLVFDQFEELFTYPAGDINNFKEALAEVFFTTIPEVFRAALKDPAKKLEEKELLQLHTSLPVKVLYSLRSDRIALLNRLDDRFPEIFKNLYEVFPLTRAQAKEAIVEPSQLPGNFESNAFSYTPELLANILDFLSNDQEQYIESFQVQIICKYAEELVMESKQSVIGQRDLPLPEVIFSRFYSDIMSRVPSPAYYNMQDLPIPDAATAGRIREAARKMLEEGLIYRTGGDAGIRINLYHPQVVALYPDVDDAALWTLCQERLLRATPDAAGRIRYELSHDTLVKPVLRAMDLRAREERDQADRKQLEKLQREKTKLIRQEIGISGKSYLDWDYIEKTILSGKSVLVLGEQVFRDHKGVVLFKRFIEQLKGRYPTLISYEEEQVLDPLSLTSPDVTAPDVKKQLVDYYHHAQRDLDRQLLSPISKMPFSLILSFDPSNYLRQLMDGAEIDYEFGYFSPGIADRRLQEFSTSKSKRILYNLFGSIEDDESIVLTLQDAYRHLCSVLTKGNLPLVVRHRLARAETVFLLGVNYQRLTSEAILWQLLRENNQKICMAFNGDQAFQTDQMRVQSILNIDFNELSFEKFVLQLEERLSDITAKSITDSGLNRQSILSEVNGMLVRNEVDAAIHRMMQYTLGSGDENSYLQLMAFQKRLRHIDKENLYGSSSTSQQVAGLVSEVVELVKRTLNF